MLMGLSRDLARGSDAVARAEAARTAMARLLAVAGHDLKQPLQLAMLSISRVEEDVRDPRAAQRLRLATDALRRLGRDLDDLARASQVDGAVLPKHCRVPLERLFTELKSEWSTYAEACGVALCLKATPLAVETDPAMLLTILRNLVGNAVKYTRRGGRVLVGARRCGGAVRIEVRDNGSGIEARRLATIFEAFDRGGREDAAPGLGLGLHIVKQTADALRHNVTVRSQVGHGSTFAVTVPGGCTLS